MHGPVGGHDAIIFARQGGKAHVAGVAGDDAGGGMDGGGMIAGGGGGSVEGAVDGVDEAGVDEAGVDDVTFVPMASAALGPSRVAAPSGSPEKSSGSRPQPASAIAMSRPRAWR